MMRLLLLDPKHPSITDIDSLKENYKIYPGLNLLFQLYLVFKKHGFIVLTIYTYKKHKFDYINYYKYVITNEPSIKDIFFYKKNSIHMFLAYCGESPINSTSYHLRMPFIESYYSYIFAFEGVKKIIFNKNKFLQFNWPIENIKINYSNSNDFYFRKLLVYVASAKSKYPISRRKNRFILSYIISKPRYFIDLIKRFLLGKLFGLDLSYKRFDIIKYFSSFSDFYLFGKGWDFALIHDPFFSKVSFANPPKEIDDKLTLLNNFKFSVCFENTLFPGYITEKIFDSMRAGCVPIYIGTSSIKNLIPKECYIDAADFKSMSILYDTLKSMSEYEWLARINKINEFLNGEQFINLHIDSKIAEKIYSKII